MKIKSLLLIILISFPKISITGTNVYVKNCTPYTFKVTNVEQKGETLSKKRWNVINKTITPYSKIKVLKFNRDVGIKKRKKYIFNIILKTDFPELKDVQIGLYQKIKGKAVGSKLWWSFSKNGTPKKWFANNDATWLSPFILKTNIISPNHYLHDLTLRCRTFYAGKTFKNLEYLIGGRNYHRSYTIEPVQDANKLTVLGYNTYLMHVKVLGITAEKKPGLEERTKLIPEQIKGYDVLILSEVFVGKLRRKLLVELKKMGYNYSTCILGSGFLWKGNPNKYKLGESLSQPFIVDFNNPKFGTDKMYTQAGKGDSILTKKTFKPSNGGIIIISKYPITKTQELVYKTKTKSEDRFAKKGVVYAKINKKGKNYHIFGTHPEAVDVEARFNQLKELYTFIESQKIPKMEPVLIGGDMNIEKKYEAKMLNILKAINPPLIGKEKFSYDLYKNQLNHLKLEKSRRLDYILYSKLYKHPENSYNEIRPITSITNWKTKDFYPTNDLSDHYAIYGFFDFSEPEPILVNQFKNRLP